MDIQGFNTGRLTLSGLSQISGERIELTDSDLRHLSGNTITVPVIAAILGFVKVVTPKLVVRSVSHTKEELAGHGELLYCGRDQTTVQGTTDFDTLLPTKGTPRQLGQCSRGEDDDGDEGSSREHSIEGFG